MRVAHPFVEEIPVEPIIRLKNQARGDLDFLGQFQKSRAKELAYEFTSGIYDLETNYQELDQETEKSIGKLTPSKNEEEDKVRPLQEKWKDLATETGIYAESARNTPRGADGKVHVIFKEYWDTKQIDGWRVFGVGTLYLKGDEESKINAIEEFCQKNDTTHRTFRTGFKGDESNENKKDIHEWVKPGTYLMWPMHPDECRPHSKPSGEKIKRPKDQDQVVIIQLTTPAEKPKYKTYK